MKQGLADITIVLDRSGSMSSVAADTIGGFNTFVDTQKALPGEATLTLRQFDDQHETVYSKPVKDAPKMDATTFQPRGSTALLDAIGLAITETGARLKGLPESERPERVIVAIITDGQENASAKFNRAQVFKMISEQRDIYKWEFAFIGANQDAIAEAGSIGIPAGAAMNYAHTAKGTSGTFRSLGASMGRARAGASVAMSFNEDEREDALGK